MIKPHSPKKGPYKVAVVRGKTYFWCSCGLSSKQPFCDGTHKTEGKFRSLKFIASENEELFFCGCKLTSNSPFCDGSHSK